MTTLQIATLAVSLTALPLMTSATAAEPPPSAPAAATNATAQRVIDAYAGLRTYHDVITMSQSITLAEGAEDPMGFAEQMSAGTQKMRFAWDRSKQFSVVSPSPMGDTSVVGTADTITIVSGALGQYREMARPTSGVLEALNEDMIAGGVTHHPVFALLLGDPANRASTPYALLHATNERTITHDGAERIELQTTLALDENEAEMFGVTSIGMVVQVDPATHHITRVTMDLTELFTSAMANAGGAMGGMPEIEAMRMNVTFDEKHVNESLPEKAFVAVVDDHEKVDAFNFGAMAGGAPEPAFNVGDDAPDFTAKRLSGDEIALSSLRGQVVVLDFWATWCGPCVRAMPDVQKVAAEFASHGVIVLGVNQDQTPDAVSKVKAFVKQNNITIDHFLDPKNAIGGLYKVTAIPTTVVIDANGVVRSYEVGFHGADALRDAIKSALEAGTAG